MKRKLLVLFSLSLTFRLALSAAAPAPPRMSRALRAATSRSTGWLGAAGKTEITPDLARPVYLAGFGYKGRKATAIHDPFYARAVALGDARQTIVLASLDLIGLPRPYVEKIRQGFPEVYILIASVHTHSGPDTLGHWGPSLGASGVDPIYIDSVIIKTQALIREILGRLEPVELVIAKTTAPAAGLVRDLRDPIVIDNEMNVLALRRPRSKKILASIVEWSCHPEVLG
ncbi:MAG: hypothetical protein AAB091_05345, partial [Elusimicrobiota bacterium]